MRRPITLMIKNSTLVLLFIWLGLVVYWHLNAISGLLTVRDYVFQPWMLIRYWTLFGWMPWVPLVPLVLYLANKLPIMPNNWRRGVLLHSSLMFGVTLVHGFMSAMLYYEVGSMDAEMATYAPWQHTGHLLFGNSVFLFDAFIYLFIVTSQNIHHFYMLAQQKEMDAMRMRSQLAESRLQALKMQINPHFLFNTLNSIAVLIRKNRAYDAAEMLGYLSDFFRQTLEDGTANMILLGKEIGLVRQYLNIEKVRFGERLEIEYRISPSALDVFVPVMLLQPIVENAVKHGLNNKPGVCRLELRGELHEGMLQLTVTDNGTGLDGIDVQSDRGVGLKNVCSRLRQHYGDDFLFSLTGNDAEGASVRILLPTSYPVSNEVYV